MTISHITATARGEAPLASSTVASAPAVKRAAIAESAPAQAAYFVEACVWKKKKSVPRKLVDLVGCQLAEIFTETEICQQNTKDAMKYAFEGAKIADFEGVTLM